MSFININSLKKKFGQTNVLRGLSLQLNEKTQCVLQGSSGSGKSTLLYIIGGLDSSDEGDVIIDGKNLKGLSEEQLANYRNQFIGFVFQFHHLLPEFTALENVCIPGYIAGKKSAEVEARAKELLSWLHVDNRMQHKPNQLSGGEQQRVAVARALINAPSVILADEPSGNLDTQNAMELHHLFFQLRDAFKQTFVIVTHNTELADMADRKLTMQDGLMVG